MLLAPHSEDAAPAVGERSRAARRMRISWRFFAARSAGHPIARRLARACARGAELFQGSSSSSSSGEDIDMDAMVLRQLQQVLADDAWSIQFFGEHEVFRDSLSLKLID